MTLQQPNLLVLAKQGNVKAIATLIQHQLEPQGIQVKAALKEHCLYILLEAAQPLSQLSLVHLIQQGIQKLGLETIDQVRIYGKQTGAEQPAWSEEIRLAPHTIKGMPSVSEPYSVVSTGSSVSDRTAPSPASKPKTSRIIPKVTVYSSEKSQSSPRKAAPTLLNDEAIEPPTLCPRSHFVLSLLVTFLAFPPLGIAALIFAKQVKERYQQHDYEGAKSASETAKILSIVGICFASPFYLLLGFLLMSWALIAPSLQYQANLTQQIEAKSAIVAVNRGQQTFFVSQARFATSLPELELNPQSLNYQYRIVTADASNAIVTATPKQQGLKSYAGIVYFEPGKTGLVVNTRAAICETQQPSLVAPVAIEIKENQVKCPPGSVLSF
ncbi:MAG TPA: type IV pilin-like G/H family protein [Trichocoleus sp.]|jgi:hypothetical protein